MKKWISAILNFIVWGSGYVYNGQRFFLGIGLMIATILVHIPIIYHHTAYYLQMPGLLIMISHIMISFLLAYDGYREADRMKKSLF